MNRRKPGGKPTLALWMLVAVADLAILAATAGVVATLLIVVALVTVVGAVLGLRLAPRRAQARTEVVARRRA